jgi:hypothetical protein
MKNFHSHSWPGSWTRSLAVVAVLALALAACRFDEFAEFNEARHRPAGAAKDITYETPHTSFLPAFDDWI